MAAPLEPTKEQKQAIEITDKNLIVIAGAGSGKTHVLVERFLHLLEQKAIHAPSPDEAWRLNNLVAITFTREAALEMRKRLRREMEKRRVAAESEAERAGWTALLRQMNSARIDTIHALCASILRANAAEAGIDPRFEVLDEVQAKILLNDSVDEVLRNIAEQDHPALGLLEKYDLQTVKETLANPNWLLVNLENMPTDPDAIYQRWAQHWLAGLGHGLVKFAQLVENCYWVDDSLPAKRGDALSKAWMFFHEHLPPLVDMIRHFDELNALQILEEVEKIATHKKPGKPAAAWGDAGTSAKEDWVAIKVEAEAIIKTFGNFDETLEVTAAQELSWWCDLIRLFQSEYEAAKHRAVALDFNDLEERTRELLKTYPHVQERYQGLEFKHFLVDEFQDTNQAQWEIIQGLAKLSVGGAVFVVGDPKQSIYAFRGADVSVFNEVRQQIEQSPKGKPIPLLLSFRSHQRLVNVLNAAFDLLLTRDENSPVAAYQVKAEAMEALRKESPHEPPVVRLMLFDKHERDENNQYVLNEQNKRVALSTDDVRAWEAYELAVMLRDTVQQQSMPVHDKATGEHRPLRYGDVAILFQSMNKVNIYENVFKSVGVRYTTTAGKGFYSRQEVWDVINLLKALYNPADELALASVLRSPMFGFSDDLLLALRLLKVEDGDRKITMPLWDAIVFATQEDVMGVTYDDVQRLRFSWEILASLRQQVERVTMADLLRMAMEQTGFLAMLSGLPDGARRRSNVEKLINTIQSADYITLGALTRYLDDLIGQEIREGEATLEPEDTVRLMTVHASKGLEFPLVILADASWDRGSGGASTVILMDSAGEMACKIYDDEMQWVQPFAYGQIYKLGKLREVEQRKRLLYVAATRARDYLIISGRVTYNEKQASWGSTGWLDRLMDVFNIRDMPLQDEQIVHLADEPIQITMPRQMPARDQLVSESQRAAEQQSVSGDVSPMEPPLLRPVEIAPDAPLLHLAATQLADIGGAKFASAQEERAYYNENFRKKVLYDAPSRIPTTVVSHRPRVTGQIIGDMVHEALRYWRFPQNSPDLEDVLTGYAWRHNLTQKADRKEAVRRALRLLDRFQHSQIYDWIAASRAANLPVYTEIPFIYHQEQRIIHGIVDVLFQSTEGDWRVVDYKTGVVRHSEGGQAVFAAHARRYYLQVGAYAAAVKEQLDGTEPRVFIHYLRYTETVEIPTQQCLQELNQLEAYIGELMGQPNA